MNEITIMYLLKLAWQRLWALIIAAAVFAGAAFSYCEFLATPQYMATASVIVTNGTITSNTFQDENTTHSGSNSVSGTDISASLNLANTITDILTTSDIFKQLSEEISDVYNYDYRRLRSMASVKRKNSDTLIVNVSFTASNSKEAMYLVNEFIKLAPDYITEFIPLSKAMIADTADSANMVFPKTLVTSAAVGLIGAILAFGVAIIIDTMDHAINGEEDFTSRYDIPLLGTVPDFETTTTVSTSNYYRKGGYHSGS